MISGDKEVLIIPPVTDKLTYFNNETVRRLWREASEALYAASRSLSEDSFLETKTATQ